MRWGWLEIMSGTRTCSWVCCQMEMPTRNVDWLSTTQTMFPTVCWKAHWITGCNAKLLFFLCRWVPIKLWLDSLEKLWKLIQCFLQWHSLFLSAEMQPLLETALDVWGKAGSCHRFYWDRAFPLKWKHLVPCTHMLSAVWKKTRIIFLLK